MPWCAAPQTPVAAGGTLLVVGHDRSNLEEGYGGPQDPAILFSPDDITDDLAGIKNLRVVRADRVMRPVMTDDGERNAIDALVRAERRSSDGDHARKSAS